MYYKEYLYCADCGARLYLHRGKSIKPENNYYQCGGYQTKGGRYCTIHSIKANQLDRLVLEAIKDTTDLANENPQEFYEIAMQDGRDEALKVKKESELKRDKVEMRIN